MDEQKKAQTGEEARLDLRYSRIAVARESWWAVFLSNVKEFLTERPIKVPRGTPSAAFQPSRFGASLKDNFKEWLRPLPPSARRPIQSDMLVTSQGWFAMFWDRIHEAVAPRKLPPLEVTSQPIPVPEIWSKNQQFTKVQALSLAAHVVVIVLIILPLLPEFMSPPTQAASTRVTEIPISEYLPKLAMGNKRAGGGGGRADNLPAARGRLPKFATTQFAAPLTRPPEHAKLTVDPTVVVPPNIHIPNPDLPNYGDPVSKLVNDSMGSGSGSGIGNGNGAGIGQGEGYGVGGGTPNAGENGYGVPVCVYCPDPKYSDDGFKLKIQGAVVLDIVVGVDGRATNIHVAKGLGYGLDEEAVKSVRDIYHFKPAMGPDGRPAAVRMEIEVDFRLY